MLELFLVKIKLNLPYTVISGMFNISAVTASKWFKKVMHILYNKLKDYIVWFDRARIQSRLPPSFKALYPNTRVIIDCSEIPIQRPNKHNVRIQTYSNYKSHFTIKFLIGIAPSGETTFLSKAFGGRATDSEITVRSGLLDLLEKGDEVMADKGFPQIQQDLNRNGAFLVMPPFKYKTTRQFSTQQTKTGYEIASVRIHVERAIQRLKTFEILNYLQSNLVPDVDRILVIIAFITNCYGDLIKRK
jgi:hypothetical protein